MRESPRVAGSHCVGRALHDRRTIPRLHASSRSHIPRGAGFPTRASVTAGCHPVPTQPTACAGSTSPRIPTLIEAAAPADPDPSYTPSRRCAPRVAGRAAWKSPGRGPPFPATGPPSDAGPLGAIRAGPSGSCRHPLGHADSCARAPAPARGAGRAHASASTSSRPQLTPRRRRRSRAAGRATCSHAARTPASPAQGSSSQNSDQARDLGRLLVLEVLTARPRHVSRLRTGSR